MFTQAPPVHLTPLPKHLCSTPTNNFSLIGRPKCISISLQIYSTANVNICTHVRNFGAVLRTYINAQRGLNYFWEAKEGGGWKIWGFQVIGTLLLTLGGRGRFSLKAFKAELVISVRQIGSFRKVLINYLFRRFYLFKSVVSVGEFRDCGFSEFGQHRLCISLLYKYFVKFRRFKR